VQVAFVTPFLPWPADTGGKLRSFYLAAGLAETATVDLFTFSHSPAASANANSGPLGSLCRTVDITTLQLDANAMRPMAVLTSELPRSVRFFQAGQSLNDVRRKLMRGYDLLVCDEIVVSPYMWDIAGLERTPRLINRQKIDHLHYAEMAASRALGVDKGLDWLEARRLRRFEETEMPRYQGVVVCSQEDRQSAVLQVAGSGAPIEVIVNGADTEFFQPDRKPDLRPTVLLLGTMHYYPNIDAVLHYVQTMHEALRAAIPELQVLIVGHQPPPEIEALRNLPGITVTGSVPDIRPYMARSWIQIVPLRLGGGTRLKIVESMAAGLPVLSTSVGAQGLGAHDGDELMLADDPADFVRKAVTLLSNNDLRTEMAATARTFVEAHYSWQSLGQRFAEFCHTTAARGRVRVPQSQHR
jgi:glycosyltransferase involved in cell wall biosynthesis